ncbi:MULTISPECIES: hypothetical protein [Frankia]|nr:MULTISPECIES: hypothetical protein [Frankia]
MRAATSGPTPGTDLILIVTRLPGEAGSGPDDTPPMIAAGR